MAALAGGFSDRHFERGEGPRDEVASRPVSPVRNPTHRAGTNHKSLAQFGEHVFL